MIIRRGWTAFMFYKRISETQYFNMAGDYACFHCKELDREIARARSRSPDLPRSRDVRYRDLAPALRISKDVNSSGDTCSCFTNTFDAMGRIGRSKERDLDLRISHDLALSDPEI